jgi:hypothetical protein
MTDTVEQKPDRKRARKNDGSPRPAHMPSKKVVIIMLYEDAGGGCPDENRVWCVAFPEEALRGEPLDWLKSDAAI